MTVQETFNWLSMGFCLNRDKRMRGKSSYFDYYLYLYIFKDTTENFNGTLKREEIRFNSVYYILRTLRETVGTSIKLIRRELSI